MDKDFLRVILEKKRQEIEKAKRTVSLQSLRNIAENKKIRSLLRSLRTSGRVNIIAEIKRGSPSKGVIRKDLDPVTLVKAYERGGASAISVLTDSHFFLAKQDDLERVRLATDLPILRKDFIISIYQIYESVVMGADAVLLIVRALSPQFLRDALDLCSELSLEALVEVHCLEELEVATAAGACLIGINNRDLKTFEVNLDTTISLSRYLEKDQVVVSESGIRSREDIERLERFGIYSFLIGETLVRSGNPAARLHSLIHGERD